ncbi:hypothetical protein EDB80DRAFT_676939 [Ilyonectria destructans]|nr:hypothetical protein EDB80DRAFT_676939 [Ilyonectria destructans]
MCDHKHRQEHLHQQRRRQQQQQQRQQHQQHRQQHQQKRQQYRQSSHKRMPAQRVVLWKAIPLPDGLPALLAARLRPASVPVRLALRAWATLPRARGSPSWARRAAARQLGLRALRRASRRGRMLAAEEEELEEEEDADDDDDDGGGDNDEDDGGGDNDEDDGPVPVPQLLSFAS